ncbi:MAG: glycoside hydrolase family 71/99 protein, partial [Planctomycetota bacterium]
APAEVPARTHDKKVLAFYYPWYGNPEGASKRWYHWNPKTKRHDSTHTPELGWYDSHDRKTVDTHIEWAKSAGIDAFIVSWWGPGSFCDRAMPGILDQCEELGFQASVYYEACKSTKQLGAELRGIIEKYGGRKGFLKVGGKPVIFIYGRVMGKYTPAQFAAVFKELPDAFFVADTLDARYLEAFDGLHTYNPATPDAAGLARRYRSACLPCRLRGGLFCATVYPGYDDTVIRTPGLRIDRKGGKFYKDVWNGAVASGADWILITSFNEWHEGSEIEPSVEHGETYLQMTKKYALEWKKDEPAEIAERIRMKAYMLRVRRWNWKGDKESLEVVDELEARFKKLMEEDKLAEAEEILDRAIEMLGD